METRGRLHQVYRTPAAGVLKRAEDAGRGLPRAPTPPITERIYVSKVSKFSITGMDEDGVHVPYQVKVKVSITPSAGEEGNVMQVIHQTEGAPEADGNVM